HAFSLAQGDAMDGFDDELGSGGTGGGFAGAGTAATLDGASYRMVEFAGGEYYFRAADNYDDNDSASDLDRTITLVSRARVNGAERALESLVQFRLGADCAIITQEHLLINGNPSISGLQGCAHSNAVLEITGNPSFATEPTSSGGMEITGKPEIAGTTLDTGAAKDAYEDAHGGEPLIAVPMVNPLRFGPNELNLGNEVSDIGGYLLASNCRVYSGFGCSESDCSGGSQVANLSSGGSWSGWSCSSDSSTVPQARWNVSGNSAANGAFFIEGWVNISGNPGSSASPWLVTLVAMNSVDISGNPYLAPFTQTGDLRNIMIVSGNDVGVGGNAGVATSPGGVFAHQQVKWNGNPTLYGFIVAEDGASEWPGEPAPNCTSEKNIVCDTNQISGNPTIVYDGIDSAFFEPDLETLSWNELRQ
ncbi:MAG: hypothetical protein ACREQ9_27300, partial [Candidatus Binatia bacterium]